MNKVQNMNKGLTASFVLLGLVCAATPVQAQDHAVVGWDTNFEQFSDTNRGDVRYGFYATDSRTSSNVTLSSPNSTAYVGNGGNVNYSSLGDLQAAFPTTGIYAVNGATITAPGGMIAVPSPLIAVSSAFVGGGTWSSHYDSIVQRNVGVFNFDAAQNSAFTLSLGGLAARSAGEAGAVNMRSSYMKVYWGNVVFAEVSNMEFTGTAAVASASVTFHNSTSADNDSTDNQVYFNFNALGGNNLRVDYGYENAVLTGIGTSLMTGSDFGNYSGFTLETYNAASAVPEPSTYAAIFGGAALLVAAYRKRKQA